jgi:homoserine kinase type II
MAVYTEVNFEELEGLMEQYDIGAPVSFKGIAQGLE